MERSEIIDALSEMGEVPFSRSTLEKLEDNELAQVANDVGADGLRLALSAKVGGLRRELEDGGIVANTPPGGRKLGFQVRSTLGCGPGDVSRFEKGRDSGEDAANEDGGSSKRLSFRVRSTLGAGPGDTGRFDK